MAFTLPRTLTLPSGARVTLRQRSSEPHTAARPEQGRPLFSEVIALFDRDVALTTDKTDVDVRDLSLADFHVVRAVLTKAGLVEEDEVELDCHNCGELLVTWPCRGLETGPWEDDELGDPELDRTAEFGIPLETAPLGSGDEGEPCTVTLAPRSVRQVMPLWAALAEDPFEIDEAVVRAIGIEALGGIEDPHRIARVLADGDDAAFASVTDCFLAAHYPLRLACDVFCSKCKARNTVDAPADREFERSFAYEDAPTRGLGESAQHENLPSLEDFVELAHAVADPLIAELPGEQVQLIVESGTPAVDDGGEPLLGSYVPPPPTDAPVPVRPPTVTVYYRTFERIEREEGPFDWKGELRETIEHELEHHVFYLRGDDPMDEEEHAEIDREALRVVGRGEATRRTLAVFGLSIPDFVRRAWPLIVVAAVALAIMLAEARCGTETISSD